MNLNISELLKRSIVMNGIDYTQSMQYLNEINN